MGLSSESVLYLVPQGQPGERIETFDNQEVERQVARLQAEADAIAQACLDARVPQDTVEGRLVPMPIGWLVSADLIDYKDAHHPNSSSYLSAVVITTEGKLCTGSPINGGERTRTLRGSKHALRRIPGLREVSTVVTEPNPTFLTNPTLDFGYYQKRLAAFATTHGLPVEL